MLAQAGATLYVNTAVAATVVDVTTVGNILVFDFVCFNSHATDPSYVQLFNAVAADVTLGTTAPTFVIPLAARSNSGIIGLALPIPFRTALSLAATATATGNGAPAANVLVQLGYTGG